MSRPPPPRSPAVAPEGREGPTADDGHSPAVAPGAVGRLEPGMLRLLVSLAVLLREGSVKEAAHRLGLSAPAVSRQLQQLRDLTGDPLLVRRGNRMVPTPRAEALRAELGPRLRALQSVLDARPDFAPERLTRGFVLLATDIVCGTVLPGLTRRFVERAPGAQLRLLPVAEAPDGVAPSLWEGMADLYIGPPVALAAGMRRRRLYDPEFVVLARRGHPALAEGLDLDRYCALPHILVTTQFPPRSWVDDRLAELGRSRRVALSLPFFAGAATVVAQTDLVCTLPSGAGRRFAQMLGLDAYAPPVGASHLPIYLHWEERLQDDPANAWLREMVVEAAAEDG